MLTKTKTRWIIFILYIGAVIVSFLFADIKYHSLNFHTRDYAFYLQFTSKLLDHNITKSYSINPSGHNWLFFYGADGINSIHQTIHLEPIKYFYAVLYHFTNTPRTIFLFTSLVFFFPLLYMSLIIPMDTKRQMYAVLSIALLYVLYPSAFLTSSFDLRPYIFLAPFFFLSILSIAFSRPLWEILLCFNAMFLAREEALVFGIVMLCYAFVKFKEHPLRHKTIRSLLFTWSIWSFITIIFLIWCGYPTDLYQMMAVKFTSVSNLFIDKPIILFVASLGGITSMAVTIFSWRRLRMKIFDQRTLEIMSFGMILIPLGYQFGRSELDNILSPSLEWMVHVLFSPRYYLYFVALLGLDLILLPNIEKTIYSKARLILFLSLSVLFLSMNILAPQGVPQLYTKYHSDLKSANDIWALRDSMDKYQSWNLVDYETYQAFYDYQYVYLYNRLPWQLVSGEDRYFPANRSTVQRLVNERIEYIIVSKDSYGTVNDFLSDGGLAGVTLFENDRFYAIQVIR